MASSWTKTVFNVWKTNVPMRSKWSFQIGIDIIPTQIFGGGWDFWYITLPKIKIPVWGKGILRVLHLKTFELNYHHHYNFILV